MLSALLSDEPAAREDVRAIRRVGRWAVSDETGGGQGAATSKAGGADGSSGASGAAGVENDEVIACDTEAPSHRPRAVPVMLEDIEAATSAADVVRLLESAAARGGGIEP